MQGKLNIMVRFTVSVKPKFRVLLSEEKCPDLDELSPNWVTSLQHLFPGPDREERLLRRGTLSLTSHICLPGDAWPKTAPGEGPEERLSPVEEME